MGGRKQARALNAHDSFSNVNGLHFELFIMGLYVWLCVCRMYCCRLSWRAFNEKNNYTSLHNSLTLRHSTAGIRTLISYRLIAASHSKKNVFLIFIKHFAGHRNIADICRPCLWLLSLHLASMKCCVLWMFVPISQVNAQIAQIGHPIHLPYVGLIVSIKAKIKLRNKSVSIECCSF